VETSLRQQEFGEVSKGTPPKKNPKVLPRKGADRGVQRGILVGNSRKTLSNGRKR